MIFLFRYIFVYFSITTSPRYLIISSFVALFNDISLTRYDIRRCRMIYLLRKYDIISVPIIREAYIIARRAISYRRYITRSERNGYHCKKPLLSGRQKRFFTWSRVRESNPTKTVVRQCFFSFVADFVAELILKF